MRQFTAKEIQEKFEGLPQAVQNAIASEEVKNKLESIGERFGLHIDQIGEMIDQVGLVMLGLNKPNTFVGSLSKSISIDENKAREIANAINDDVLTIIRMSMRESEETFSEEKEAHKTPQISSLEKLGGFSIEKNEGVSGYGEATADATHDVTESDRESILSGIENPVSGNVTFSPKEIASGGAVTSDNNHTDPLIDHLLGNPVSMPEQKVQQTSSTPAPAPAKPAEPQKPRGPDPYREPIGE